MRAPWVALVGIFLVAGCSAEAGSSRDDEQGRASALASGPVAFVTTSSAVRAACAAELAQTVCTEDAAAAAEAACAARLDEKDRFSCDGPCLIRYSPLRDGACHEGLTLPDASACRAPVVDDCSFYRGCLERAVPCGESAYTLRFGERLCNVFIADQARFSEHGRTWLRAIRQCLERELVPELDAAPSCSELEAHAYASHTRCYTDPAHSICDLAHGDVLVLAELLGKDLFEPRAVEQFRAIVDACYGPK